MIAILVPVLGRPKRARPLVRSILENTEVDWRLLFLTSPGDDLERRAVRRLEREHAGVSVLDVPNPEDIGDYAKKINAGFREAQERWTPEWVFQAADDLRFHPGWDTIALELAERREMAVIATNDLGNRNVMRGQFGTHCLIRSSYVLECGGVMKAPGTVMFEGYHHNYVDQELCGVAKARGCFAFAEDSIVEHLHPNWKKDVPRDATYDKGESRFQKDQRLFVSRRRYWEGQRRVWNGPPR